MDIPKARKTQLAKLRKYGMPLAILALVIAGIALVPSILGSALPTVEGTGLWISEVKEGEFIRQVRGVGALVTVEKRWVTTESVGRVELVHVKPGAIVEAGTVIVELSNPELLQQFDQFVWELKVAETELNVLRLVKRDEKLQHEFKIAQAEIDYNTSKAIEEAKRPLYERGVISSLDYLSTQQETEGNKTMLRMLKEQQPSLEQTIAAQLEAEETRVEQMKNKLKNIERLVAGLKIQAGIPGVVQEISVEEGELAAVESNIARVANPDSLMAQLQVQEVQAKDITVGLKVEVDTRNGLVSGRVSRVDPRVNEGYVEVDVELEGSLPPGARPDLSVTGTIQVEYVRNAVYIDRPNSVSGNSTASLFVVNQAGDEAEKQKIELGRTSVNQIEIVSGLRPGDKVIVSDTSKFADYSRIKIN